MTNYEQGEVLLIDKPQGWTSFDVVAKIRNTIKVKKIGHAGTLDPLATGLLILCTGKFTKKIDEYQAQEKEYTGKLILGKTTPSYDAETKPDATFPIEHISKEALNEALKKLSGTIEQLPPMYSAIKKDGKRLYELARKGKTVELTPRQVEIKVFEITENQFPELSFRVVCSKGTYIRSLAHDFGRLLNSGAYLTELRRTRIGDFNVANAQTVEKFVKDFKEIREL